MRGTIESRMADAVGEELSAFADWCAKNWTISQELARRDAALRDMTEDYRSGYNAALEGISLALKCYLEEQAL